MTAKILIIEDNREVRENLCEILELAHYRTEAASNGKEGIEMIDTFQPDLILCDVLMPVLDGFGVLKILNDRPSSANIPFIFLTAKSEIADIRKGMGLGADDYITKPFDDVELLEAVKMRLKKYNDVSLRQPHTGLPYSKERLVSDFERELDNSEIRSYKSKDQVFNQGDTVRYVFRVLEGFVREFQVNQDNKEFTHKIHEKNGIFGWQDIFTNSRYCNSARALSNTKIQLISQSKFMEMVDGNSALKEYLIQYSSVQSQQLRKLLVDMAYLSVRQKVANALLYCSEKPGVLSHLTREELASMAGTAKESLIRTISDFRSEGLVLLDRKKIEILDFDKLKTIR